MGISVSDNFSSEPSKTPTGLYSTIWYEANWFSIFGSTVLRISFCTWGETLGWWVEYFEISLLVILREKNTLIQFSGCSDLNELIRAKILIKAVFYKGCFTEEDSNRHNFCSPSTDVLFTFKNMPVKMRIIDTDTTIEPVYIINVKYINVAIRNILEFINYNYGQEYIKETR